MNSFVLAVSICLPQVFGQTAPPFPAASRIQIPEPCPLVGKWLGQGLATGMRLDMLSYDANAGVLTFKVSDMKLNRADPGVWYTGKFVKGARVERLVLTLRTLVSSSVSFAEAPPSATVKASTCTIAGAFKIADKGGKPLASTGKMEEQMLQRIKEVYAEHGLGY